MARPRKPTSLRLLQGTNGKPAGHSRPILKDEPKPAGNLFEPPTHFSTAQREIWAYAIANAPAGLLKRLDQRMLVAWAVACDLHQTATMMQNKIDATNGAPLLVQPRDANGNPTGQAYQSPYLPIINRQALVMAKCCTELGFSPASRTRISLGAAPDRAPENEFDDV
jgi:P27 family predicted phage terminase small subunit